MYIYMKSGQQEEPVELKAKDRKRLQSEQLGVSKKYVNFTREQQLGKGCPSPERGLGRIESSVEQECDPSEEAPLYANCQEEEELYTEVS